MKKKIFGFLISASMISLSASSQTIKENIDKLARDKSARDKADKADVLRQKKIIFDSAQVKTIPVSKATEVSIVNKTIAKKNRSKKKRKTSSK